MFLPDNELHEIGLLFYSYLIQKLSHEVLYLGQATPFFALTEASEKWNPDILVTGYNLLDRRIESNGVMDLAKKLGITIIAYPHLAQTGAGFYKNIKNKESTNKLNAGKDLTSESFTLICIEIAPIIRTAIPIAAGFVKTGTNIPAIKNAARASLKNPINFINQSGRP